MSEKVFAHALAGSFKMAEYNHEEVIALIDWMHKNSVRAVAQKDSPTGNPLSIDYQLNQKVDITDCLDVTTTISTFTITTTEYLYYTFSIYNTSIIYNVFKLPTTLDNELRAEEYKTFQIAKRTKEQRKRWNEMSEIMKGKWEYENPSSYDNAEDWTDNSVKKYVDKCTAKPYKSNSVTEEIKNTYIVAEQEYKETKKMLNDIMKEYKEKIDD